MSISSMDLWTPSSTVTCAVGDNTWTINGAFGMEMIRVNMAVYAGSRHGVVNDTTPRLYRISSVNVGAGTFTTYENAAVAFNAVPFRITGADNSTLSAQSQVFSLANMLAETEGTNTALFAGGGSARNLVRNAGAASIAALNFRLRSGTSLSTTHMLRQRQVSGQEVFEIVASPDGVQEIIALAVNRLTGALTAAAGLTLGGALAVTGDMRFNGAAGTFRNMRLQTAGVDRLIWGLTNEAESGPADGSNGFLNAWNNDGTFRGSVLSVNRATQVVDFAVTPTAGGGSMWHAGNFGRPQAATGIGQYVNIATAAGGAFTLPAGGTWAYHLMRVAANGALYSGWYGAGIAAGGTAIYPGHSGEFGLGWAWRIQ